MHPIVKRPHDPMQHVHISLSVIPAQAGIQAGVADAILTDVLPWTPTFVGVTAGKMAQ